VAAGLLDRFDGWTAADLRVLRSYSLSCMRLSALEAQSDPGMALHREMRANISLLAALNLERAK
jgi:hypothetical protein